MVKVCAVAWCKKKQDTKSVHPETSETRIGKSTHVQFGVTDNNGGVQKGKDDLADISVIFFLYVPCLDKTAETSVANFFCLATPEMENPTAILRISSPHCLKQEFQLSNLVFLFPSPNLSVSLWTAIAYIPPTGFCTARFVKYGGGFLNLSTLAETRCQ